MPFLWAGNPLGCRLDVLMSRNDRTKKHRFRTIDNESRVVEITSRTIQGRYLLRPSRRVNDLIVGVLGRAQTKYGVTIYCFVFMSNHFHLLMKAESVKKMSRFVGFVKKNIAAELSRVHGWRGPFWGRRFSHSAVGNTDLDEGRRLRYIFANGCKEGLVASPLDWPGVTSTTALCRGETTLRGTWFDRTAADKDKRRKLGKKRRFRSVERVRLSPLPFLAEHTAAERCQYMSDAVFEIQNKTAAQHRQEGTSPTGTRGILQENPLASPEKFDSTPAPRFLTSDGDELTKMRHARDQKHIAYAIAADRLERGESDYEFPQDCFPPGLPFVSQRAPT